MRVYYLGTQFDILYASPNYPISSLGQITQYYFRFVRDPLDRTSQTLTPVSSLKYFECG
jgi:hypothetical protein